MKITPPPAHYDGRFCEFYERYVEPNLPSADRVQEFDSRLRQHLSREDPVSVVRYVSAQTLGTIYRTDCGSRVFPTDNAPVWWTHALLHSGDALPEDASALFDKMRTTSSKWHVSRRSIRPDIMRRTSCRQRIATSIGSLGRAMS